jgi:hypothetical protein
MGTNSFAKFVRLSDVVGTNRDEPAIAHFNLTIEFQEAFVLPIESL